MIFYLQNRTVSRGFVFILFCFLLLPPFLVKGQSLLFPGDYFFDVPRQRAILADTGEIVHTSMQPFIYKKDVPDTFRKVKAGVDPFYDKAFYQNLIEVRYTDRSSGYPRKFNFDINPLFNFSYGKDMIDTSNSKLSNNTRGFWIRGELGKKIIFETAFIENQSFFPLYLNNFVNASGVAPGQGRFKPFKITGFDYASSYGIIHFAASRNLYIRLGHGKQKTGNGYRSLLLSDNAFNYPYLQFTANFLKSKVQFSQTYALLMNLTDGGTKTPPGTERVFQKKAATFQHLSWHTGRYLDIYLFQGTVWKATDSNNVMHLDPLYANPIIFSNLAKFGFGNANHIIAGGGFEFRPFKKIVVYNQDVYDGTYQDYSSGLTKHNWAMQNGIKYFDVLGVKDLFVQAEVNMVQGQCYYYPKYAAQNYSQYNQFLTTPALLPNELVGIVAYYYKRLFVQLKENYFTDNNTDATISNFDAKIGYMINAHYKMNISAGCTFRAYDSGVKNVRTEQTQIIYISFKTSLYNIYHDF